MDFGGALESRDVARDRSWWCCLVRSGCRRVRSFAAGVESFKLGGSTVYVPVANTGQCWR